MNEQKQHITPSSRTQEDADLDRLISQARPASFDNTRIKSLFHEKVEAERRRVRSFRRRMVGSFIGAAAVVAVILTLSLGLFTAKDTAPLSTLSAGQLADAGYSEINVRPGGREEIHLSDGSVLMANAGTHLIYPNEFTGRERRIYADGEIYINVAKDKDHPFIVESRNFDVRVLGTTFNVQNSSDSTAAVVLVEGSVEILNGSNPIAKLRPSDMAEMLRGNITSLRQVDTSEYTSWTDGLMTLRGETLGSLTKRLARYYSTDISCDASLSDVKIYGKLDLRDSVGQILTSIEEIVPMKITRSGDKFRLTKKKS